MKENERLKSGCLSVVYFSITNHPQLKKKSVITSEFADSVMVLLLALPALCHVDSALVGPLRWPGLSACGLSASKKPDKDLKVVRVCD